MSAMMGTNIYTNALFVIAAVTALGFLLATLFTIIYERVVYERSYRRRYDTSYTPPCAIIVPCKGEPKDLKRNLETFVGLDYPDYSVIYAVERDDDPAVPVIREVVASNDRASLVVAGLSERCAQKNHNMLAAIREATDAEVYVFADADIGPAPNWLRELVLPLSDPKVTATTGFRWQYSTSGRVAEQIHSFINNTMYVLFCTASYVSGLGLWGGSMAMRRRDFEELDVARRWSETAVDDISLSEILMRRSKKAVLVPPCVTHTDDTIQSVRQGILWFERQCMFLKAYHRGTWQAAILLTPLWLGLWLWLPASLLLSGFSSLSFLSVGGGAAAVFIAGVTLTTLFHPLLGANPTFVRFVLSEPFSIVSFLIGLSRTAFTNTITWSGVKYRLARRGTVASVVRPDFGATPQQ